METLSSTVFQPQGQLLTEGLPHFSPHFVYQAVYVNTDDASPVKVGTDGTVRT